MEEIKKEKLDSARQKMSLNKETADIKILDKDPSLAYVYKPQVKTKFELDRKKKQENVDLFILFISFIAE
jgi:hypothetical protein